MTDNPKGPFGGPRLSNIGPFVSDEIQVIENTDVKSTANKPPELELVMEEEGLSQRSVLLYTVEVIVKQLPEEGPLQGVRDALADLGERVAFTKFYVVQDEVAYIDRTQVDPRLRREGLGTAVRQEALNTMQDIGVEVAYTFPVSKAGVKLAESQGFKDISIGTKMFMVKEFDSQE